MRRTVRQEQIRVWRLDGMPGLELRSGVAVKAPYPRHWHEEYQLCLIQAGGGELLYRGVHHNTPATSLFIVHPGEVHANQTDTGCSFRSIYVTPEVVREAAAGMSGKERSLPFFPNPLIFDREIISFYQAVYEPHATPLERETALLEMLTTLTIRFANGTYEPRASGNENKAVGMVREYIVERHNRNISLRELAQLVNLSAFHLTRVFTKEIGMPPHAFQTQVRVARAKQLLMRGMPASMVAATTGFADQSHFIRHFKRLMKITPGEYLRTARTFNTDAAFRRLVFFSKTQLKRDSPRIPLVGVAGS